MALSGAILVQAPARGTAMGCGASSGGASSGGGLLVENPASDNKDWEELTSAEQEAATKLGFTASSWDGPSGPGSGRHVDQDGRTVGRSRLELFLLGYDFSSSIFSLSFTSSDFNGLPPAQQEAVRTLGWVRTADCRAGAFGERWEFLSFSS